LAGVGQFLQDFIGFFAIVLTLLKNDEMSP
jgi:hypothetical protein